MTQTLSADEQARLAAVARYDVLDSPPDGVFDRIAALAARLLDVPIAIVSVVDTDRIWFKSHHGLDIDQVDREPGLCASAILGDEPWVVTDAAHDPRTLANPLVAGEFGLRFYAGAPLTTYDGYNLGTLCVIDREPREISAEQTRFLTDLAAVVIDELELRRSSRLAVAAAETRLHEVEALARALQASLLPPSLPDIAFLDVAAYYRPASRYEVGGDLYDVFPMTDASWAFVLADVMGKGPQAAGRTGRARFTMRAAAIHEDLPSGVLQTVNQALLADTDNGPDVPFVTGLFVRAQRDGDGTLVRFASAGHPLPTRLRADGSVDVVGTPGTLLGVFPELDLTDVSVRLDPGDSLVLITDGVHDSGRPALHQEGLEELLRGCKGMDATAVVDRIQQAVSVAPRDDVAVLVMTARIA